MAAPASVLSDGTIRRLVAEGRLRIEPWDERMVQPASVDLKLGPSFRVFHNHRIQVIDLAAPPSDLTEHVEVEPGEPFVIHPGEFVLGRTVEYVRMPDDLVARIEGKALALDTEVPTPDGWRTMGDLQPDDWVFDALGEPVQVVAATDVLHDRPCFEVELCDGTTVVADAQHLWATSTESDRRYGRWPSPRTTEQIARDLARSPAQRHHVQQTASVRYAEQELALDPYALGAWIGGGRSTVEQPASRELEVAGAAASRTRAPRGLPGADALPGDPGLPGRDHVPAAYLRASADQRQALLEGLMDSHGSCDEHGRCRLTAATAQLAQQYAELLASLGFRPQLRETRADAGGVRHEVRFTPHRTVFRLARMIARQRIAARLELGRAIVGVRPVPSVPVRCIEVASAEGLFLVTRRYVPTHNSSLGRLGLIVHATAGFVDPGFEGTLTLEITNFNSVPIVLRPQLPIAQLSLMTLDRPAERPYGHPELGSHYHGQVEATESRYEGGPGASAADRVRR